MKTVWAWMTVLCLASGAAGASQVVEGLPGAPDASCRAPAAAVDADLMTGRAEALASYQELPSHCLKKLFVACNRAAAEGFLDFGSAAVCSIGYEALLARGFDGNFQALMTWWQGQRGAPAMTPLSH
jgi:hypothetical protein